MRGNSEESVENIDRFALRISNKDHEVWDKLTSVESDSKSLIESELIFMEKHFSKKYMPTEVELTKLTELLDAFRKACSDHYHDSATPEAIDLFFLSLEDSIKDIDKVISGLGKWKDKSLNPHIQQAEHLKKSLESLILPARLKRNIRKGSLKRVSGPDSFFFEYFVLPAKKQLSSGRNFMWLAAGLYEKFFPIESDFSSTSDVRRRNLVDKINNRLKRRK